MKKLLILLLALTLLTACSAPAAPRDCKAVSDAVLSSQPFSENMTEQTEARLQKVLGLTQGQYAQAIMTIDASRATAEAVIIVTAAAKSDVAAIQALLEGYRDVTLMQYRDYRPAEAPKLEAAKVQVNGLQLALIVAPDQAKAVEALNKAWK